MTDHPDWIAVDWGTTHLRVFAMRGTTVIDQADSPDGMGTLSRAGFEPALLRLIGRWLDPRPDARPMRVVACGMVGARQGWAEAPYRAVPCAPVAPGELLIAPTTDPRLRVAIVPGLSQDDPADVMRGEETQLAGLLELQPGFEGCAILPGTHSKHVQIRAGRVTRFHTAMTGELFALLAQQSVLRHSTADDTPDPEAFAIGLDQGRAGQSFHALFALRAESLLAGLAPSAARARLSGLLIGAELAGLPDGPLALIGSGPLVGLYRAALAHLGREVAAHDGGTLARAGLALAAEGAPA
ncbi:2-dehydro-3-deoxygalactonokinase [Frigidibacter sp. MR17.24]|uniref:2-dehydro-3-deoxygalactonokinase n=1 Tax=Frigidibacter sp. MR17.24 TaxID=3127345 RepID=UPI003012D0F7